MADETMIYKLIGYCQACKWGTDVTDKKPPYRCELCSKPVGVISQTTHVFKAAEKDKAEDAPAEKVLEGRWPIKI